MPAVRRTKFMELLWALHTRIYKISGGRLGNKVFGMRVLMLKTIGRKSGEARVNGLYYIQDGNAYVVIASNAGDGRHPAWLLNLRAHPEAEVQVKGHHIPVLGREAVGDERDRLWTKAVEADSAYQTYQERTARHIPVVVLEPKPL